MTVRATHRGVATAAVVFAMAGCAGAPTGQAQDEAPVVTALCAAQEADPTEAQERFANVHAQLHTLASQTAEHDRAAAGRLLEAKRAVEVTLEQPPGARGELDSQLARLTDAVRAARRVLGEPAPPCDPDEATR